MIVVVLSLLGNILKWPKDNLSPDCVIVTEQTASSLALISLTKLTLMC